jgi:F-box and leucine-rich repeat protein 14
MVNLENLTNLRTLIVIQCAGVSDAGLRSLRHLKSMEHLTISGCSTVSDAAIQSTISPLTSLQSLYITRCPQITDDGLRALSQLTNLTELAAGYCPLLSDDGLASLSHLTRLTMFYLPGCPKITSEMRLKIKASASDEAPSSPDRPLRAQTQQRRSLQFPLSK